MKPRHWIFLIAAALAAAGVYLFVSHSPRPLVRMIQGALGIRGSEYGPLTGGYDNSRTSANLSETILTPANVKPGSFGRIFSLAVDGQIYAQPMYLPNLTIGDGVHNVIFAATMHNTVYAFDADVPALPLWSVNLGPAVPTSNYTSNTGDYYDIAPENGILGTPVIDSSTGTLYAVAASLENGSYFYRLHALDVTTGAERFGAPAAITGQVSGTGDGSTNGRIDFDPRQHLQRPALLLARGNVYVAFGSHGDSIPYHGWIMGYSAQDVQHQVSLFNPTPDGSGGAFWQSGRGLTADPEGNIYGVPSNGDTDLKANFGNSVVRLDATASKIADWFVPYNFHDLNETDQDVGTTGAMLIDGTNLLVIAGKEGVIYLLDRGNLGHSAANDGQVIQRLDTHGGLIFNMALWNRPDGPLLYTHSVNASITAYRLQGKTFGSSPVATSENGFPVPYQGMTLSANGTQPGTGVLWVLAPYGSPRSPAVLHAYNADGLQEIWNSGITEGDSVGGYSKFSNPTVANGRVYIPGNSNQLVVYGLSKNASANPVFTAIVNGASLGNGPLAGGEIITIFGQNLGPVETAAGSADANGKVSSQLGDAQVTFNGVPGPLLGVSAGWISAVVPFEVAGDASISVVVSYRGKSTPAQAVRGAATSPGLFTNDATGSGPGLILNQDGSWNSPDQPAAAGSTIVLSATGGGQTNPPGKTGAVAAATAPLEASDVSVTVRGRAAEVTYAGAAAGQIAGAMQVIAVLPESVTGTVPVVLTVGGRSTPATVTVSIR